MFFYWVCWVVAYLPLRILYPLRLVGRKNLPKKQKAILACNHISNLDAPLINSHLHRRPLTLAKHTLFENKFIGWFIRCFGGIPVNRDAVGISTIKTVLNVLKEDKWLTVFPEGTRGHTNEEEQMALKNGVALFALKSGAPIVPMWYIKKPKLFRFNKLLIGEPFTLSQFEGQKPTKEVLEQASEYISSKMKELRDNYFAEKEAKKKGKRKKVKI